MNLFVLLAPYQVLSALECCERLGITPDRLVMIDAGYFPRDSVRAVVDPARWGSVEILDDELLEFQGRTSRFASRGLGQRVVEIGRTMDHARVRSVVDRLVRRTPFLETLVLGHYRISTPTLSSHLAQRLSYRELVVLDPGTDALRVGAFRRAEAGARRSPPPSSLRSRLRRRFVDWDDAPAPRITFFSAYPIPVDPPDTLIRNDFRHLRASLGSRARSDEVWFVGQPLVDQGYLTRETFAHALRQVCDHTEGERIVYYRHPRESDVQLREVVALDLEIRRNVAPFEFEICFGSRLPSRVAAFFSSALDGCAAILGERVPLTSFRLPSAVFLKQTSEVDAVYDHFTHDLAGIVEVVPVQASSIGRT